MSARANPGAEFESAFRRSIPAGVYTRRLPTPSAVGFRVPQLVELAEQLHGSVRNLWGLLKTYAIEDDLPGDGRSAFFPNSWEKVCRICSGRNGEHAACLLSREPDPLPEWLAKMGKFSFTPKAGFDLQLTAPARGEGWQINGNPERPFGAAPAWIPARPLVVLDLELKSVAVDRLDFGNVDPAQEKALAAGAAAAHVAALVVEFRRAGEVWVLPIQVWQEYRLTAQRSSMPLADARRLGMPILRDEGRGVKLPYWKIGAWLRKCGAEIAP